MKKIFILFIIIALLMTESVTLKKAYTRYVSSYNSDITFNVREPIYSVTFNSNGGSGNPIIEEFNYGESKNLINNLFTKSGNTFVQWNTKSDDTGTVYKNGEVVSNLTTIEGENINLYAIYINNNDYIIISNMTKSSGANTSNDNYDYNSIFSTVNLPNQNSTVTYKVDITNYTNKMWGIYSINGLPSNLEYEITNYELKDKLCDVNNSNGVTESIYITIKYKDGGYNSNSTTYNLDLDFIFKKVYSITYENIYSANNYPSDVILNNYFNNSGGTIDINSITYPEYLMEGESATIEFYPHIPNNLSVTNTVTSTYTKPSLALSNPTNNITITNLTEGDIVMYDHPTSVTFSGSNNIDTGIKLLSNTNIKRDFRIEYTIDSRGTNSNLATLFNIMNTESTSSYGITFRINNGQYRLEANGGTNISSPKNYAYNQVQSVVIEKVSGIVSISINGGTFTKISNYSNFSNNLSQTAIFGSSIQSNGTANRYFKGAMSNMKITYLETSGSTPSVDPSSPTEKTYWVKLNSTSELTTDDIFMFADSNSNVAISYNTGGTTFVASSISVAEKGSTAGRTYYEISGDGYNERSQWKVEVNETVNAIYSIDSNSRYMRITTSTALNNIVTSKSTSATNIAITPTGSNGLWNLIRASANTTGSTYYVNYSSGSFVVQTSKTNADLNVYKKIKVTETENPPEEEQSSLDERWKLVTSTDDIIAGETYLIKYNDDDNDNYLGTNGSSAIIRDTVIFEKDPESDYYITTDATKYLRWQFSVDGTGGVLQNLANNQYLYFNNGNLSVDTTNKTTTTINLINDEYWKIRSRIDNEDYYLKYNDDNQNNNFHISTGDSNNTFKIYKLVSETDIHLVEKVFWVKLKSTSELTTDKIYMITDSNNQSVLSYNTGGTTFVASSINVTEKGSTEGRTYYEISGDGYNERSQWKIETNETVNSVYSVADNATYMRITTSTALKNIVTSGSKSTGIAMIPVGSNDYWRLIRASGYTTGSTYYVNYSSSSFSVQTSNTNANLNIYTQITVMVPEETSRQTTNWELVTNTDNIKAGETYLIKYNDDNNNNYLGIDSSDNIIAGTITLNSNTQTGYYVTSDATNYFRWKFDTNTTGGALQNIGNNQYLNFNTGTLSMNSSSKTTTTMSLVNSSYWTIRSSINSQNYYLKYTTENNFFAATGQNYRNFKIYKLVTATEPEPDEPIPDDNFETAYEHLESYTFSNSNNLNTGISLFSAENFDKDFEITLTIDSVGSGNGNDKDTILNSMYEGTTSQVGYPGFAFRIESGSYVITANQDAAFIKYAIEQSNPNDNLKTIKFTREDGKLYYQINNKAKEFVYDFSDGKTPTFNTVVTFGSSLNTSGSQIRNFEGSISNMTIKLEK